MRFRSSSRPPLFPGKWVTSHQAFQGVWQQRQYHCFRKKDPVRIRCIYCRFRQSEVAQLEIFFRDSTVANLVIRAPETALSNLGPTDSFDAPFLRGSGTVTNEISLPLVDLSFPYRGQHPQKRYFMGLQIKDG